MLTFAPLSSPFGLCSRPAIAALADRASNRMAEHLVLLLPLLLLPMAAPADVQRLAFIYVMLVATDVGLLALATGSLNPRERTVTAIAGAGAWLGAAPLLGAGTMLTFGLFVLVRCVEHGLPPRLWLLRLGLTALATALVIDLALVAMAMERSIVWLALGAAVGLATATAWRLRDPEPDDDLRSLPAPALTEPARAPIEAIWVSAIVLILALYGALLAHEPMLTAAASSGGFLSVPFLALALLRLALMTLDRPQHRGPDLLALLLLAAWALIASTTLGHA